MAKRQEPGLVATVALVILTLLGIFCIGMAAAGALKILSGWTE